jgi:hypothetical protein
VGGVEGMARESGVLMGREKEVLLRVWEPRGRCESRRRDGISVEILT